MNNRTEIVTTGSILEGLKCEVYTRKEVLKGLQKDPITSKPMIKYELSRNCSVEIVQALVLTDDDEKKKRTEKSVYGNLGDKMKGDRISLYIDQRLPVKVIVREGITHTHGGHLISTKNRTVAVLKYQFPNLPDLLNGLEQQKLTE